MPLIWPQKCHRSTNSINIQIHSGDYRPSSYKLNRIVLQCQLTASFVHCHINKWHCNFYRFSHSLFRIHRKSDIPHRVCFTFLNTDTACLKGWCSIDELEMDVIFLQTIRHTAYLELDETFCNPSIVSFAFSIHVRCFLCFFLYFSYYGMLRNKKNQDLNRRH